MKRTIMAVVAAVLLAGPAVSQDSSGVRMVAKIYDSIGMASCVAVRDTIAFIGSWGFEQDGLRVVNISNPTRPQEIGFCAAPQSVRGLAVEGDYAYLAAHEDGLRIVDISDLTNPVEIGYYNTPGQAFGVDIEGSYAFVADMEGGLRILDMSNQSDPQEVGWYDSPGRARSVLVVNSLAYLADNEGGLRIIDVTGEDHPQEIGYFVEQGHAYDVKVAGNLAYIAVWGNGLFVLNIVDPSDPRVTGYYGYQGFMDCESVSLSGEYAFVAAGVFDGLQILNISNPQSPTRVGWYFTPGSAESVVAIGGLAYLADGTNFSIYDCSEAMFVPVTEVTPQLSSFGLIPAFPNPFNNRTTVVFSLPRPGEARLSLFNPLGQRVKELTPSGWLSTGTHQVSFGAEGLPSGDYFLRLDTGEQVLQQRVVLVK